MVYFVLSPILSSLTWILMVQNNFSLSFNKPTDHGIILYYVQISWEIWEKMSAHVFASSCNCNLEWRSRSLKQLSEWRLSDLYDLAKFERNLCVNVWTSQRKTFFDKIILVKFSLLTLDMINENDVQQTSKFQQHNEFLQNQLRTLCDSSQISFCLLAPLWPWIKVKFT